MGRILVGTSSWADAELAHTGFYPADVNTPEGHLRYYASRFQVAEIDSSYHFFPSRRNLEHWLGNTPEGFTFNVRAFALFSQHPTPFTSLPKFIREKYAGQIEAKDSIYLHHLPEAAVDELWTIFNGLVETIRKAGKLGAVFFQLPPWFHPEPRIIEYLAKCRERLAPYPMAVEFRVGSWLDKHLEETLKFLREQGITLVCVDEPQGLKSSVPPVAEITAPLGIIRFHGRNKETWEMKDLMANERFNYLYSDDELKEWVPRIQAMSAKSSALHVIFKNKHEDFSVRNAVRMKELLGLI